MANNRMYLVHVPTGVGIFLAKRMAWGWYSSEMKDKNLQDRLDKFFEYLEKERIYGDGKQDDFQILMEDAEYGPNVLPWEDLKELVTDDRVVKIRHIENP